MFVIGSQRLSLRLCAFDAVLIAAEAVVLVLTTFLLIVFLKYIVDLALGCASIFVFVTAAIVAALFICLLGLSLLLLLLICRIILTLCFKTKSFIFFIIRLQLVSSSTTVSRELIIGTAQEFLMLLLSILILLILADVQKFVDQVCFAIVHSALFANLCFY
jgi:hypothetical protein